MRIWTYQMLFKARALERVEIRQERWRISHEKFLIIQELGENTSREEE